MKKIISLILAALLLLSMTACGGKQETPAGTGTQEQTQPQQDPAPTHGQSQETEPADWGVDGKMSVRKDAESVNIRFKWPHFYGSPASTGEACTQGDGTMVLADKYKMGISPEDVALKDVYPAYKSQIENALADFMGGSYSNGEVVLEAGEISTIGAYEVCKYAGKHTYQDNGKAVEHQVVLYATTAQKNGGIFYFMVEDVTEDQSAGQLIQSHAEKIIQSIQEN